MCHVDKTTGKITGIGGLKGGIGKTFTCTVRGDKVFEHGKTFLEVCKNRVLDDLTAFCTCLLGFSHKTAHTGELTDLVLRTTGTGIEHHVDCVEALVSLRHLLHQHVGELGVDLCPDIDDLLVAFLIGDKTHLEVVHDFCHLSISFVDNLFLLRRDEHVAEVEGQTAAECHVVAEVLDVVEELCRAGDTALLDDDGDDVAERLLGQNLVEISYFLGDVLIDEDTTDGSVLYDMADRIAVFVDIVDKDLDRCVERDATFVICNLSLFGSVECMSFTFVAGAELGDIVQTEDHILRRHGDRRAVGRVEDIVRTEHEHLCFQNGFVAERQVNSHLVAVEVGVEARTSQRVQLDSLSFDEFGLECKNAESVQCRGTVEKYGMTFHHVFEDVPYDGFLTVDNLLGALDGLDNAALDELADDKRFVELGRHIFGQTALAHLEFRTDDDDRTCRVVDALTEEVLTETTLLAFE